MCIRDSFYCSSKECNFCLWEDNKFFSSKKKKLTKKIAKEPVSYTHLDVYKRQGAGYAPNAV